MKRVLLITALCLLPGLAAAATLVDDFDLYSLGEVGTVTQTWEGSTAATIVTDADNTANKVMQITEGGGSQMSAYDVLSTDATIADGAIKTMFLRFKATAAIDSSFGLTDIDAPNIGGTDWNQFRVQVAIVNGTIRARNGGTTLTLTTAAGGTIALNTNWYNLWIVVDRTAATDTFKVYMNQSGDNGATEADRLISGTTTSFNFRTATVDALDRFYWRAQGGVVTRILQLDDIYVSSGQDLSNPAGIYGAHNPTPASGATNVALDQILSWTTGEDPASAGNPNPAITKHYISFRKGDPNLAYAGHTTLDEVAASGATGSWTPPTTGANAMAVDGTYYWRIDESVNNSGRTDPNTIFGSVWRFDAIKSIPVIETQPKDAVAAENDSVQFSLKATLATGTLKYTWYYSADATADAGDSQVGTDANSLTVSSVSIEDEGYYYCTVVKVGNEANPVTSSIVTLGMKRPVAHWTLDALDVNGNYEDSIGNHDADPNGTPSFVTGAGTGTNNGVFISQANRSDATAGTWNPSEMTNQFTLSLWAKWAGQTTPTTWQGLFSKETSYGSGNMMWQLEVVNAAQASSTVMLKNGLETGNLTIDPLTVDTWEHLTLTFDGTTATIYRNGVNVASGAWSMGTKTDAPVNIGISAQSLTENLMFNGALDDVRLWNYALTQTAVVDLYHAVTGLSACVDKPTYDFDDDCLVTLSDFALLASEWLNNGLYQVPMMN